MSKIPGIRGFVEIEYLDPKTNEVLFKEDAEEFDIENLVVNYFREILPLQLAPRIITGRANNSPSNSSWLDRRIALVGFGIGDAALTSPTVKPEEPEDGRSKLVGEAGYPNSKQGLQRPIRRVPLSPSGPSEAHSAAVPVNSYYLLKEIDADGVSVFQVENGGAEITFTFTIEEDEFVGNIMEYGLFFGGGDAGDDSTFEVDPSEFERRRLTREAAVMAARKTRVSPLEKTRNFKFRLNWRLRT